MNSKYSIYSCNVSQQSINVATNCDIKVEPSIEVINGRLNCYIPSGSYSDVNKVGISRS